MALLKELKVNVNKKSNSAAECLDIEDQEEDGFTEGNTKLGKSIASFSFGMNDNHKDSQETIQQQLVSANSKEDLRPVEKILKIISNEQTLKENITKAIPKGLTPLINGEQFTLKRCYQFRQSTVRKLNELKANHPDVNAYLNTILDEAILHYHNHIFNESGEYKTPQTR